MKNVLVTGGAGFIGSNFVRFLLQAEPNVRIVNLDRLTYAGRLENLEDLPDPDRHIFIHGDICDQTLVKSIFQQYLIDTIVHFAAESHVDRSIHGPGAFLQTNVVGTFTLLEAAREAWIKDQIVPLVETRFHHVSTDEVFGSLEPGEPAFREDTPYDPRSPYSASKASSDHFVRAYHHTYGLPVTITNCSNNYGPCQFPEKLIPLMILNAVSGKPLPVYGDGRQVRDWLYVTDHCDAIYRVLVDGKVGETYNIGGDNQPYNLEIINKICAILDEHLPNSPFRPHDNLIQFVTDRPGHDRRYDMDTTKIRAEIGWRPSESLDSGLEKTVDWYLTHPEWVSAIQTESDYKKWIDRNYTTREGQP